MTDIKLYDGCFVKAVDGTIAGPLSKTRDAYGRAYFEAGLSSWWPEGQVNDNNVYDTLGPNEQGFAVVAVYPSLAAAAAANPGM